MRRGLPSGRTRRRAERRPCPSGSGKSYRGAYAQSMLKYVGVIVVVALFAAVTAWAALFLLVLVAYSYARTSRRAAEATRP